MAEHEQEIFATSDDLGEDKPWEKLRLPSMNRWVRVRILDTPEVSRLQFLPDLLGFASLLAKIQIDPGSEEVKTEELVAENLKYEAHVVHLAVMQTADLTPAPCDHCTFDHPRALWSPRQAARLQPADLKAVAEVALGGRRLDAVRPFSEDETQSDSALPADSGGSTPPTS